MVLELALPRFIAFGLNPKGSYLHPRLRGSYLGYVRDDEKKDGCIQFLETNAESPYAKFEVEFASADHGLFHIRSCQNNKYLERKVCWITATAKKKEEDQSKESCTLFKFISVDPVLTTVRIHVQSGYHLCSWGSSDPTGHWRTSADYRVLAEFDKYDIQGWDIFQLIDWSSLLILPRYVAFKEDNGKYLCLRNQDPNRPYMQFATDDIGDSTVPLEIVVTTDGNIRIKPTCTDKFWRRNANWIWADSDDTRSNDNDTLFHPVKVDNKTIGLINLGNNYFCKRLTTEGKTDCLNAAVPSFTKEAQIIMEEPF
ncbi:hypothetical protein V6N13_054820 [Hibiscus sabdariffa]|uniref:Agglutinin domain-containing protein n=1 Tax=Hibiscus sabdariffa TaxID=183260 RepID=A0ABR2DWM3_9ROSI